MGSSQIRAGVRSVTRGAIRTSTFLGAATLAVGTAILLESALSFLGFGIQPPVPSWGNLLHSASPWLAQAPWLAIPPGLCILLTVLSVNFLGDGLRDAMEPRD